MRHMLLIESRAIGPSPLCRLWPMQTTRTFPTMTVPTNPHREPPAPQLLRVATYNIHKGVQ